MKDEDFAGIMAGLEDAVAYAKGDTTRGRIVAGPDIRAIRQATGKSQTEFAKSFHLSVATIRDWEQSRRAPDGPARVLLSLIAAEPRTIERMLAKGA